MYIHFCYNAKAAFLWNLAVYKKIREGQFGKSMPVIQAYTFTLVTESLQQPKHVRERPLYANSFPLLINRVTADSR
jgi:hypothetical protein